MLTQRLTSTNTALGDRHAVRERAAGIHTWRDGFFENSDELHSVHRLPSLSRHTVARSVVSVAAQHTGRILLLPRSSVGSSHGRDQSLRERQGFPGAPSVFSYLDAARIFNDCGAESRLAASPPTVCILCCREGKGRALPSRGRISRTYGRATCRIH